MPIFILKHKTTLTALPQVKSQKIEKGYKPLNSFMEKEKYVGVRGECSKKYYVFITSP
jgi:hypothetical protein